MTWQIHEDQALQGNTLDLAKLIEFIQPYPAWVKGTIVIWLVGLALLVGALILLRPAPNSPTNQTDAATTAARSRSPSSAATESLSVGEIIAAVNTVAPVQQNDIARNYVGIPVDWTGYLRKVEEDSRDPKRIQVFLAENKDAVVSSSILFTIGRSDLPELKVLHKDSKLAVSGHIVSVHGQGLFVIVEPTQVTVLERVK